MSEKRLTVTDLQSLRDRGEKIAAVTAYDHAFARLFDAAGADLLLVGDSLAMTVLGLENTLGATLDAMVHHTAAVVRGTRRALVAADLPFGTYQTGPVDAFRSAARLLQEGGAQAVKIEWCPQAPQITHFLSENGVPVLGHLGFTPQRLHRLGGYRVQGKGEKGAALLVRQARDLERAGAFALVLELIPPEAARKVTRAVRIPTIGIGAGPHCDGQIQVMHDLLGLDPSFRPRHARTYRALHSEVREAVRRYVADVKSGRFAPDGVDRAGSRGKK